MRASQPARRLNRIRLLAGVLAAMSLPGCGGVSPSPAHSATPTSHSTPTPTLDQAGQIHQYITVLSTDLSPLVRIDSACGSSAAACGRALDQEGALAAKAVSDLQHLAAEPDAIRTPVEDIREQARFVVDIDQSYDAGGMDPAEAIRAYTPEYLTIEHDLTLLQAHQ
jgi:hypothetical protein